MISPRTIVNKAGIGPVCPHDKSEANKNGRLACVRCGKLLDCVSDPIADPAPVKRKRYTCFIGGLLHHADKPGGPWTRV